MHSTEQDENALAVRARDGDREALALLVERLRLWLFAIAYAELGHYQDAQDAVASALARTCLHIGDLRQPERLRAWLRSVAQNEARRLLRKRAHTDILLEINDLPQEPVSEAISLLRWDVVLQL